MKKSSCILIRNTRGELALQKRAANDDRYPSRWDFAAGGGLEAGETPEECAKRELKEELGIGSPLEFVMLMHHPGGSDPHDEPDDVSIFKTKYDGPFSPDPKEVAEVRFFPVEKMRQMAEHEARTLHPELLYFLNYYGNVLLSSTL